VLLGRVTIAGIATCYELDVSEIESRWERDFPHPSGPTAHPVSYAIGTGVFPGVKSPGRGVHHPPHLATRLKKEYSYTSTPPPLILSLRGLF